LYIHISYIYVEKIFIYLNVVVGSYLIMK